MAKGNWMSLAALAAQRYGIPPGIFIRQIRQESGGNPNARSPAGALGIAQFMPATARGMGVDPMNPRSALMGAARMDAQNLHKYGNWKDVLSLYNSGKGWAQGQGISETRNYVNSILRGASPGGTPGGSQSASPAMNPLGGGNSSDFRMQLAQKLLEASSNGGQMDTGSLLGMALARSAQPSTTTEPPPNVGEKYKGGGRVSLEGNSAHLNGGFISKLQAAVSSIGGTQVRITSGYRSPEHNRAIGGAQNSNHMYGHAIDGDVFIPGRGWQPLGEALKGVAPKFGLRSGATFTWGGKPDIVHVDDGYNQR